ncbi:MAG TPA: hypothetical protein VFQ35_22580 [Polyangiaceae bacterium]|nr:hypothetical protein [Polyangiaceae bacterium]
MRLPALVLTIVAVLAARRAGADPPRADVELGDDARLARVVNLYEAGKYSECATELGVMLAPEAPRKLRDREVLENARIYHAACLIGSGDVAAADEPLRAAIRANIQMKAPDSLVFPPPVIERFLRVRQSLYEEIKKAEEQRVQQARRAAQEQAARARAEKERVEALERLATQEVTVVKNRRWVALVPFGVGQFQNGDEGLGWVFLTSETVLAATAFTSIAMQTGLQLEAQRLHNPANNAVLSTWHTLVVVSSYAFLGVAATGIAQAQLGFVPETRVVRERPLPLELRRKTSSISLEPNVSVVPGSAFVGLSGRF